LVVDAAEATIPRHAENLDDPANYAFTTAGDRDSPTLGDLLRLGLSGVTADDLVDIEDGKIGLWVAWHARGYRRLENGDYAVVNKPDPVRQSWRTGSDGRLRGRSEIPDHLLHDVDQSELALFSGHASRSGFTVTWDGTPAKRGVIGARPCLPAVIVCPNAGCGARNDVHRMKPGELPDTAKRAAEDARRQRIEAAFLRDHPEMERGGDLTHLPRAERERRVQERLRERKAKYQQWFKDSER
jgi:hypothetical protein